MSLETQHKAAKNHQLGDAWKVLKQLAHEHHERTGHRVWTHYRGITDLHVQCFDCQEPL